MVHKNDYFLITNQLKYQKNLRYVSRKILLHMRLLCFTSHYSC